MAEKNGIYKCNVCGNVVEMVIVGGGTLVCCNEDMEFLPGKEENSSAEKHVPFIEELEDGYLVKVGENEQHPMLDKHYIMWIEIIVNNKVYRHELKPNDKPEATFKVEKGNVIAREYCNIHGLWKNIK
ncbi:MAG TPA: desulfoferrodoxin [Clostridiales bacterium]|nr:MAG: desulfoferrodoxin [Clostridiales bacterium GWD2_32_19]HCC08237.1 desulfoferrodoxin [Clostridiales bacterium]